MAEPSRQSSKSLENSRPTNDRASKRSDGRRRMAGLDGEHHSVEALYQSYAPKLAATLRKMYGDGPPGPDDVAQAAFFKVIERGDIHSIKNLRAFLWSTARNILRKEIRSHSVRDRYVLDVERIFFAPTGDVQSPERVIEAKQQLSAINTALRAMPRRRRHAFILNRIDGMSVAAVARELGVSRTAAAKHIARAMADLDACLAIDAEL